VIGERYRVVRTLGAGGIGVVCEAENTWTRRRVAIKLLQAKTADDPEQLERFRVEAQTTSALRHPNIVDILDMGPDAATGRLFIIQELLDGDTLQSLVDARRPLSPRAAFDLIVPVMGALAAAHAKGVLHRDIKPSNIFLAKDEHGETTPKLIDFGLAKVLHGDDDRHKTRTGSIVGTPYYMAPEQARGESGVDARIDVWAVGVVLFELLSGRVPFDGDNTLAVMWKIASNPAPRLDAAAPEVPPAVADLVARALANSRDERFPSMTAFLEAVLACPMLDVPGVPSLATRHARSLPAALSGRSSSPSSAPSPPDSLALRPTLSASEPTAPAPPDLRATPMGWSSTPGAPSPRRSRALLAALGVLLVAGTTAALVRASSHTVTAPAARAATAPLAPPVPAPPPPVASHALAAPPDAALLAPGAAPAGTPPRATIGARRRSPVRPARPAQVTTAPEAPPRPSAPSRHTQRFDPDRLLDNTQ
jgi:serine/threonine protein kinase